MLDLVCKQTQMKPGINHFDFGFAYLSLLSRFSVTRCGWGSLVCHAASKYGTKSRGITLAPAQAEFGREWAKKLNVCDQVCVFENCMTTDNGSRSKSMSWITARLTKLQNMTLLLAWKWPSMLAFVTFKSFFCKFEQSSNSQRLHYHQGQTDA